MIDILKEDEYILQRAILSTPCFNHKDQTGTQCTKCLLVDWCQVASAPPANAPSATIHTKESKHPHAIFALICSGCEEEIPAGHEYVEVPSHGIFHPSCAEKILYIPF
jgi:hypothetical protein